MAVFPGGATVAAAEGVIGASLNTLESLVAKSLLVRRNERLTMLETVREYALERLAEDPDADMVELRLADWCRKLAHDAAPHLRQADRVTWLARLDAELPNILAALSWALEQPRAELALELVGEMGEYWWYSNRWQDGLTWFDAALDHGLGASDRALATALLYRARLRGLPHRSYQEHVEDPRPVCVSFGHATTGLGLRPAWATCHGSRRGSVALSKRTLSLSKRSGQRSKQLMSAPLPSRSR